MSRISNRDDRPKLKPVEKVEVDEKHFWPRLIVVLVLIGVAAAALSYAISGLVSANEGWQEITVSSSGQITCASDFVLNYELGKGNLSATAEKKQLKILYTQTAEQAYHLFSSYESTAECNNLAAVNQHAGETVEVAPELYEAFKTLETSGSRILYYGAIYSEYFDLFACESDTEASLRDPKKSTQAASILETMAGFAGDGNSVRLELLGGNRVCLNLSDAYRTFAAENQITAFLDFGVVKNAFIIDYLAKALEDNGFTNGNLSSADGYYRNLDTRGNTYALDFYDRSQGSTKQICRMQYFGVTSLVSFRAYPLTEAERYRFYVYENGDIVTPYVSAETGVSHTAINQLFVCGNEGCAKTALQALPAFTAGSFDPSALTGLDFAYVSGNTVYYTGANFTPTDLYSSDTLTYQAEQIG